MSDVVIEIGGDATGAEKASDKAADAIKGLAREFDKAKGQIKGFTEEAKKAADGTKKAGEGAKKAGDETKKAGEKYRPAAEAVQQFNRVLNAARGSIGGVGEAMAGFAAGADKGRSSLLLAASAAAAGVAAAGLLGGAFVSLTGKIVGTITNIDELSASLTKQQQAHLAPHIARLQESKEEMTELSQAATGFSIVLAADLAPAIDGTSAGLADMINNATRLIDTLNKPVRIGDNDGSLGAFLYDLGRIAFAKDTDLIAADLRGFDKLPPNLGESPLAESFPESTFDETDIIGDPNPTSSLDLRDRASVPGNNRGPMGRGTTGEDVAASFWGADFSDTAALWTDIVREEEAERAKIAAEFAAKTDAARAAYAAREAQRIADLTAAEEAAQADREQAAVLAGQGIMDVLGAVSEFTQQQAAADTDATREERLRQFQAQKAIAIAQAAIGAALSVVQAFSQLGPVAGAVAAATTAVVTGIQIATIASAQPNFHVGGMLAPDERFSIATTRDNETTAFLTSQAVDRMGGPQAAQDFAQTGRVRGDRGGDIYLVLDGERLKARQFAKPDPRIGQRRSG